MRKGLLVLLLAVILSVGAQAQCSICTKTAAQLGEKPAEGLNAGIIYLAFTPLAIVGFVAWRWFKGGTEGGLSDTQSEVV